MVILANIDSNTSSVVGLFLVEKKKKPVKSCPHI